MRPNNSKKYNADILVHNLRQIKYPDPGNANSMLSGNPEVYLPIIHYTLFNYSPLVAKYLSDNHYDMFAKNDLDFITTAFKCLNKLFNFRPEITTNQFFSSTYAENKINLCNAIIEIVILKDAELTKEMARTNYKKKVMAANSSSPDSKMSSPSSMNNNSLNQKELIDKRNKEMNEKGVYNKNLYKNFMNEENQVQDKPSPRFCDNSNKIDINLIRTDLIVDTSKEVPNLNKRSNRFEYQYANNNSSLYNNNSMNDTNEYQFPAKVKEMNIPESTMSKNEQSLNNCPDTLNYGDNQDDDNNVDMNSILQVITSLSDSVNQMVEKIENFKVNIEERLNVLDSQVQNMKSKQDFHDVQIERLNKALMDIQIDNQSKQIALDRLSENQMNTSSPKINAYKKVIIDKKTNVNNIDNSNINDLNKTMPISGSNININQRAKSTENNKITSDQKEINNNMNNINHINNSNHSKNSNKYLISSYSNNNFNRNNKDNSASKEKLNYEYLYKKYSSSTSTPLRKNEEKSINPHLINPLTNLREYENNYKRTQKLGEKILKQNIIAENNNSIEKDIVKEDQNTDKKEPILKEEAENINTQEEKQVIISNNDSAMKNEEASSSNIIYNEDNLCKDKANGSEKKISDKESKEEDENASIYKRSIISNNNSKATSNKYDDIDKIIEDSEKRFLETQKLLERYNSNMNKNLKIVLPKIEIPQEKIEKIEKNEKNENSSNGNDLIKNE